MAEKTRKPIDAGRMMQLYRDLEAKAAERKGVAAMTKEERASYMREAKARSRRRAEEAETLSGVPEPTADNVRAALADAALLILTTNAPGYTVVRDILREVFPNKPGLWSKVAADAKKGKFKFRKVELPARADGDE